MSAKHTQIPGLRTQLHRVAVALAFVGLAGCSTEEPVAEAAPVVRPALVQTVSIHDQADLTFNGVVRAVQRADLSFRIGGRLTDVLVKEGENVKKGQVLAKLDARDIETALASAKTQWQNSESEYLRGKTVYENTQAITKSELDKLKSQRDLAKNAYTEATRKVEYATLKAPFDGIIGQKFVDNHTQIQANSPVFAAQNLEKMEVVIQVPDQIMLSGRRNNQSATAELSAIPNVFFPLTLANYATQADPVSQTYSVALSFDDLKGYNVLPGMVVKVHPTAKEASNTTSRVVTIPLNAVTPNNQGQQFVWIVNTENQVEQRVVHIGRINGSKVTILSGLNIGEKIVTAGLSSLQKGMVVRPYREGDA